MSFVLAPVVVLGVVILIHELGHFFAARAVGVTVSRFSVGFGPALFKIKRGETEYVLAAIPLGGYVKMAPQFDQQRLRARVFVFAAGPAMNLLLSFGLYSGLSWRYGAELPDVMGFGATPPELQMCLADSGSAASAVKAGFVSGSRLTADVTLLTAGAVRDLAVGDASLHQVGGPVAIVRESIDAAHHGVAQLLWLMALVSIGLAVFNFLPMPPLDGGQIALDLIGAARGGALSVRTRAWITIAGALVMLAVLVIATMNDVAAWRAGL